MNRERLEELAALHAAGALTPEELAELQAALRSGDAAAQAEVAAFHNVAALLAEAALTPQRPPPEVKARLFERLEHHQRPSAPAEVAAGFALHRAQEESGWRQLPIPGASVKILSIDRQSGYAIVLGKLEAGARYPAHRHFGSEDVYMLTGDLHLGGVVLGPGDFHHADPGTVHGVNYSENGCTLLAVLSVEDLKAQADPASEKWILT